MVSAARRLGEMPTLAERIAALERVVAEQAAQITEQMKRIAALEARGEVEDQVDGPAPRPLSSNWKPLRQAAAMAGYSWSGLRKKIMTHREGPRWWKLRGSRIFVDVTAMPRKVV
jgi:hypothetical protein